MFEFLTNSVEYQGWGLNALTLSAIGMFAFMFPESWGIWKQNKMIWEYESGKSVSIRWFAYLGCYFIATFFYGIAINSFAVAIVGGVIGILHVPLVIGLWKFKEGTGELTTNEKVQTVLFLVMVPAMAFLPWKESMYFIFSIGTIYSLMTQPWELWKTKSTGVIEIRLVIIYLASTFFWLIFAFTAEALALMIVAPCAIVLLGLTWFMWAYYRRREIRVSA